MPISSPLNLPKWLKENSHLLQPPINNYCVYNEDFTVMIVGGASGNARTDYHINTTPEWFYQYKGPMVLKIVDDGVFRDIIIREGDMFLLPPNTPHNPVRFADTVGIVLEQKRPEGNLDRLRWYCQDCKEVVYEDAFYCTDLGTQIKEAVNKFRSDDSLRTCKNCGALAEVERTKDSLPDLD
ncbi:3-hydroxyanthranilic acid dioxygenase [Orbilia oligospora]|uniref:3-hydroxyanthranilate 3,4-dioxygenase n=1 Tax=Orbilia oligospora TaxID=2813651 RepID=A0A7C8KCH5_ORBOL|nr:3-hydroxyanthranilic acid dioxygenase [Orbilia oligospora]KAF3098447.1 3-hydroxyanthranilic acid dioxygenase [Orbilia oligospora]KAF3115103.1 3-hydroxyanthranilic acid dioxygenase [Orbilia oligospora]KAF3120679.1 3-hydroxyanthranilic acid dioxygenase [Orbilia oligospora]KAF3123288.1 3-hydroxyanthranilic acid dioxygenase [Orbilia oligospora]